MRPRSASSRLSSSARPGERERARAPDAQQLGHARRPRRRPRSSRASPSRASGSQRARDPRPGRRACGHGAERLARARVHLRGVELEREALGAERGQAQQAALERRAREVELAAAVWAQRRARTARYGHRPPRATSCSVKVARPISLPNVAVRPCLPLDGGPHVPDVGAGLELAARDAEGGLRGPADEHALAVHEELHVVVRGALERLPGQQRRGRAHDAAVERAQRDQRRELDDDARRLDRDVARCGRRRRARTSRSGPRCSLTFADVPRPL